MVRTHSCYKVLSPLITLVIRFASTNTSSFCFDLISHCSCSLVSAPQVKSVHAHFLKLGVCRDTYLANCLVGLYCRVGPLSNAFQLFDEMPIRNVNSWNILLAGCFKLGDLESARWVFAEMPEWDVVSWNTVISGCSSNRMVDVAFEVFLGMLHGGIKPSAFTYSIVVSCVSSMSRGKELHGNILRSGLNISNVVVGNALIDMYGKLACIDYAFSVFETMRKLDVVSWNTLLSACDKSGCLECTLDLFRLMRATGFMYDEFTISKVINTSAKLQDLESGKQIFAQSIKMGFLSNSIVTSAIIDMFSNCNRLEDSILLYKETRKWDISLINSMISSYMRHGFLEEAMRLFPMTSRENTKPTAFTIACILNSLSFLVLADQGTQMHALVIKLGMHLELVVATSILDMYTKYGMIDHALKIFMEMDAKDIIVWNTMIIGLARNGREIQAMRTFREQCASGLRPDRVTLAGVLLACGHIGLVSEGWNIFSSMEDKYGVTPSVEHYTYIVEMMCRARQLKEAMEVIESMPFKPNTSIWCVLLEACRIYGEVRLSEEVARRMMEFGPQEPLPYLVLSQAHAMKGEWDSVARVRRSMKQRLVKKVIGCSWIGIRNQVIVFNANTVLHHGWKDVNDLLYLLMSDMRASGYYPQQFSMVGDGGED